MIVERERLGTVSVPHCSCMDGIRRTTCGRDMYASDGSVYDSA